MRPLPCSHSALECHNNCPAMYNEKYVKKSLPPEQKSALASDPFSMRRAAGGPPAGRPEVVFNGTALRACGVLGGLVAARG